MSYNTIILSAGKTNYADLPIGMSVSNALIPVNGKPVVGWILNDLIAKNIQEATVVVHAQDKKVIDFLRRVYSEKMTLNIVPLEKSESILNSLTAGINAVPSADKVRVILGDTLIRDSYDSEEDFAYTGYVESSRRWCLVEADQNNTITEYIDKVDLEISKGIALAGYYHFNDKAVLESAVKEALKEGKKELSSVLKKYGEKKKFKMRSTSEWFDFGHIDSLVDARRRLLQPRHFNNLQINPLYNTIKKVSENNEKLKDELNWYLNIPDELKILTPRIVEQKIVDGKIHITQEYYGYSTLAELYLYSELDKDSWTSILKKIFQIHHELKKYHKEISKEGLKNIYLDKTFERLDMLKKQDPFWEKVLGLNEIKINGSTLKNLPLLKGSMERMVSRLSANQDGSIIHGDYCFSNILFDITNQIIRLIDPRGSFGEKGIYGDPRYDIAKLRHSACSLYDFIVSDMFSVTENDLEFESKIFAPQSHEHVAHTFDRMAMENGYNLDEIKFIEGLLFISMVPLHSDHFRRQEIMYLTGIQLLNNVL